MKNMAVIENNLLWGRAMQGVDLAQGRLPTTVQASAGETTGNQPLASKCGIITRGQNAHATTVETPMLRPTEAEDDRV